MPSSTLYERLFHPPKRGKGILVLLDPDRIERRKLKTIVESVSSSNKVKAFLVGTSLLYSPDFDLFVKDLKGISQIPVLLFPGSSNQVSSYADGILLLSLISGRNPELLIGEQVRMAPIIKRFDIEAIPTAYILIGTGGCSSVEFISNTRAIPCDKLDIITAHGMAAEYLGFKLLYLEAGSGAKSPVPQSVIESLRESISLPIIVGGGIKNYNSIKKAYDAGADYTVVGTAIEKNTDFLKGLG